ncbi:hypothetical protein NQ318_005312 [Aromia moschata]|uniref:Claspin n=1 Tax=Aromia moschata TaxID=1265417 RepID=A0AAV8XUK2_9CUCU|nr:hypothetical protein NQ318_005312 [Aromia moschata]
MTRVPRKVNERRRKLLIFKMMWKMIVQMMVEPDMDNVGYDSEENEVELTEEDSFGLLRGRGRAVRTPEWGSEDEDEKDLDAMEFEQGDTEKFNEKKIKRDLERIHMRQLLDDDAREIEMLQELLLEDGEFHDVHRVRQFKWKNINSILDGEEDRRAEDDVFIEEEESEEQWRKRRHEREMFLKEKLGKAKSLGDDDDLLSESQLLKIGHKVIQRSQQHSQGSTPVEKAKADPDSPVGKQPFQLVNKRGSFLQRNDQVLQRLAEYNKTTLTVGGCEEFEDFPDKKRKATDGTPRVIKKLRLSENLSPALGRKKADKPQTAKAKLFGNW